MKKQKNLKKSYKSILFLHNMLKKTKKCSIINEYGRLFFKKRQCFIKIDILLRKKRFKRITKKQLKKVIQM